MWEIIEQTAIMEMLRTWPRAINKIAILTIKKFPQQTCMEMKKQIYLIWKYSLHFNSFGKEQCDMKRLGGKRRLPEGIKD